MIVKLQDWTPQVDPSCYVATSATVIGQVTLHRGASIWFNTVVRGDMAPDEAAIRTTLPASVASEDQPRFIALAMAEFKTLHAGNAIRFGLRPLEFAAWTERHG